MEAVELKQNKEKYLVVGMGLTGYSMIRYLLNVGYAVSACDTRDRPPFAEQIQQQFPMVPQINGVPYALFSDFDKVVVSPGIKIEAGYDVIGDIELFVQRNTKPIIAITGSNGKSTVTMLVQIMLDAAGYNAIVGGNIGKPVLELLNEPNAEFYVLEMSSFQLETTYSLSAKSACVLNLSSDHMDRYKNLEDYQSAKMRIYNNAENHVVNREQLEIYDSKVKANAYSFALDEPINEKQFGLRKEATNVYFAQGERLLFPVSEQALEGEHNRLNILAACALVAAAGVEVDSEMVHRACQYTGLEHRCERVAQQKGVVWINDSKGTNVGATCAAIEGFQAPIVLIAGGVGKGADFTPLRQAMSNKVSHLIVLGEDGKLIAKQAPRNVEVIEVSDLAQAVEVAREVSVFGSTVLFSPACASFDMFRDFEHRGQIFKDLVRERVINQEMFS